MNYCLIVKHSMSKGYYITNLINFSYYCIAHEGFLFRSKPFLLRQLAYEKKNKRIKAPRTRFTAFER